MRRVLLWWQALHSRAANARSSSRIAGAPRCDIRPVRARSSKGCRELWAISVGLKTTSLRLSGRSTPVPCQPDDGHSSRNLNNAEERVVRRWYPNKQTRCLYGSHDRTGCDVCPAVRPVPQHSGQEHHGDEDLHEDPGSQQESLSNRKTVYVACQELPEQSRIHQACEYIHQTCGRESRSSGRQGQSLGDPISNVIAWTPPLSIVDASTKKDGLADSGPLYCL